MELVIFPSLALKVLFRSNSGSGMRRVTCQASFESAINEWDNRPVCNMFIMYRVPRFVSCIGGVLAETSVLKEIHCY